MLVKFVRILRAWWQILRQNPLPNNTNADVFFQETLARCCGVGGFKGRRGQRCSYSTLSRSQQRANGIFGCRNGGGGIAQESTDCSGNSQSARDDSFHQSTTGHHRTGGPNFISRNPSYDSSQHASGKRSSSRRTLSTEVGTSDANGTETCGSNRSFRGYHYRGRWSSTRTSFTSTNGHRQGDEGIAVPTGDPKTPESPTSMERVKVKSTAIVYRPNGKTRSTRRWWNLFKWLSNRKPASEGRRISYSSPGPVENVIINVQVNLEEYSMTPCNISNTSLRDVDRRAMDEELSAYMEEIRKREFQNEMRDSGNG